MDNLVNHPAHADLLQRIDDQLQARLDGVDDTFEPAETYIQQWKYPVDAQGTMPWTD